jgi:hypothetical protein
MKGGTPEDRCLEELFKAVDTAKTLVAEYGEFLTLPKTIHALEKKRHKLAQALRAARAATRGR